MPQIELGPINISAPGFGIGPSPSLGSSPPMGNPALVKMHARAQRDRAYTQGSCLEMFAKLLESLKHARPAYGFVEPLKHDLVTAHHADYLQCITPHMPDADAWRAGRQKSQPDKHVWHANIDRRTGTLGKYVHYHESV
ncbi:lipid II-degrading bacteriocin [Pseudomonas sp. C2L12B]|nr:lipid II-degrading bacteriocin [Pseudomonas typographi]MBD1588269.1 lipid II-degrading bacteriocin [Pseudomonas typographi]